MSDVQGANPSINVGENRQGMRTPVDGAIIAFANRVGGSKAKEVERFLKFAIVGTIGAMVDFGVLNLLQGTFLPPSTELNVAIAVTVSFVAALMSNFTWNRYWTYPDSRSRSVRRQLVQFAFVSVIGWSVRTFWVSNAFRFMGVFVVRIIQLVSPIYSADVITQNRLGTNGALLIGVFVVMIWNFFVNRYWTYSDVE